MAFPQNWNGAAIDLNLLMVPATDPTAELSPGGPPFSGTTYELQIIFIPVSPRPESRCRRISLPGTIRLLEFAEPLADATDAYFGRVLGYGPDPLLAFGPANPPDLLAADVTEPPISLDPEPVRVITPGQTADTAGLDAMTQLVPALPQLGPGGKPQPVRHFLLPIPPGISPDSPELFGFWTYELRVGHAGTGLTNWSTAQARFGRPLRVTGVQHPAPVLKCLVSRGSDGVRASAPFATPVLDGKKQFSFGQPWTKIWVLLYVQVSRPMARHAEMYCCSPSGPTRHPQRWARTCFWIPLPQGTSMVSRCSARRMTRRPAEQALKPY